MPGIKGAKKYKFEERPVSVRAVLEPEELRFCQMYLAFGKRDRSEAYRRAFLRKNNRGEWIDVPKGVVLDNHELQNMPPIASSVVSQRAANLLSIGHIRDAIAEMERGTSELARKTITDSLLFGTPQEKAKAVERVMAEEDKLGFRDAAEKWAEIMCQVGAEVVLPLGTIQRSYVCSHCRETNEVSIDLSVEAPLSDFFPKHAPQPESQPD